MSHGQLQRLDLTMGDGCVTVRNSGGHVIRVAKILGRRIEDGSEVVYLDRLVHHEGNAVEGWHLSGAITTILKRPETFPDSDLSPVD